MKKTSLSILILLIVALCASIFFACGSTEKNPPAAEPSVTELKDEVEIAFAGLSVAGNPSVDNENGTIYFEVANEIASLDFSSLRFSAGTLTIKTEDGTPVTSPVLSEGENRFLITVTKGTITLDYTLKIVRRAAEPAAPSTPHEHALGAWSTYLPATCIVKGEERRYCSGCEYFEKRTLEIDPDHHNYTDTVTLEPTYLSEGERTYRCVDCGHNYAEVISALDPSEGLSFALREDDTYEVTGMGICTDTNLGIPSRYQEKAVTSIASEAFRDRKELTSVTIPSSVKSLGTNAFYGCDNLASVVLSEGLDRIDGYVFYNCKALTAITLPQSLTGIGEYAFLGCKSLQSFVIPNGVTSVGGSILSGCSALVDLTIPYVGNRPGVGRSDTYQYPLGYLFGRESYGGSKGAEGAFFIESSTDAVTLTYYLPSSLRNLTVTNAGYIPRGAFYGINTFDRITIKNATRIGESAFNTKVPWNKTFVLELLDCPSLMLDSWAFERCNGLNQALVIEKGWSFTGGNPFDGATFSSIALEEGNPRYHIAGNCLIETETKRLVAAFKDPEIPSDGSVTTIAASAFSMRDDMTDITIPTSVKTIERNAFDKNVNLTSITLPNSVTSIGRRAFADCYKLSAIVLSSGLTTISQSAFQNCISLQSVECPSSLRSIGRDAFNGCGALSEITIPASVTSIGTSAFTGCPLVTVYYGGFISSWCDITGLTNLMQYKPKKSLYFNGVLLEGDLIIPSDVTAIPSDAFKGCVNLTSVIIPASVTSIGTNVFGHCRQLTSITVESGNSVYHSAGNCIIETDSGTLIAGCGTSEIPSDGSVTSIAGYALCGFDYTSLVIPNSVTRIEYEAFRACDLLSSVTLSENLTTLAKGVFYGCESLTSIILPESLTSIGSEAFKECYKLVEIYNKSALELEIGSQDNGYVAFYAKEIYTSEFESKVSVNDDGYILYTEGDSVSLLGYSGSETNLILPMVTEINKYAFYGCNDLTLAIIPNGVTTIGDYAFSHCSGLLSLTIPASVTEIGSYAFDACEKLVSIIVESGNPVYHSAGNCLIETESKRMIRGCRTSVIPTDGSVTTLADSAFWQCTTLTSVTVPSGVTTIERVAFKYCYALTTVRLPASLASIGNECFLDDAFLEDLYFEGTVAEWYSITKGSKWNYNAGLYTVHCSDGDIVR